MALLTWDGVTRISRAAPEIELVRWTARRVKRSARRSSGNPDKRSWIRWVTNKVSVRASVQSHFLT
jgi:hypothetical protein